MKGGGSLRGMVVVDADVDVDGGGARVPAACCVLERRGAGGSGV